MADRSGIGSILKGNRAYDDLLRWVLLVALIAFGSVILWDYGFLNYLIDNDTSGISSLIIAIFAAASIYCLWFLFDLSHELSSAERATETIGTDGPQALAAFTGSRRVTRVIHDMVVVQKEGRHGDLTTLLQASSSEMRAPVRLGVFVADALYKLGLLGTVIGFILMLVSMRDLGEFDVETMREALQNMTGGMAVALLTTITGLICGLLLRIEFNILDSLALRVMQRLVRFGEVVLPGAVANGGRDV